MSTPTGANGSGDKRRSISFGAFDETKDSGITPERPKSILRASIIQETPSPLAASPRRPTSVAKPRDNDKLKPRRASVLSLKRTAGAQEELMCTNYRTCGVLYKCNAGLMASAWHDRWCIISKGSLWLYNADNYPKDIVDLQRPFQISVERGKNTKDKHYFQFSLVAFTEDAEAAGKNGKAGSSKETKFLFAAPTSGERARVMALIEAASDCVVPEELDMAAGKYEIVEGFLSIPTSGTFDGGWTERFCMLEDGGMLWYNERPGEKEMESARPTGGMVVRPGTSVALYSKGAWHCLDVTVPSNKVATKPAKYVFASKVVAEPLRWRAKLEEIIDEVEVAAEQEKEESDMASNTQANARTSVNIGDILVSDDDGDSSAPTSDDDDDEEEGEEYFDAVGDEGKPLKPVMPSMPPPTKRLSQMQSASKQWWNKGDNAAGRARSVSMDDESGDDSWDDESTGSLAKAISAGTKGGASGYDSEPDVKEFDYDLKGPNGRPVSVAIGPQEALGCDDPGLCGKLLRRKTVTSKSGARKEYWDVRWAIIHDDCSVALYDDDNYLKARFPIDGAQIREYISEEHQFALRLDVVRPSKGKLVFAACSHSDQERWLKVLRGATSGKPFAQLGPMAEDYGVEGFLSVRVGGGDEFSQAFVVVQEAGMAWYASADSDVELGSVDLERGARCTLGTVEGVAADGSDLHVFTLTTPDRKSVTFGSTVVSEPWRWAIALDSYFVLQAEGNIELKVSTPAQSEARLSRVIATENKLGGAPPAAPPPQPPAPSASSSSSSRPAPPKAPTRNLSTVSVLTDVDDIDDTDDEIFEGPLYYYVAGMWKQRWCVLYPSALHMFADEATRDTADPLQIIALDSRDAAVRVRMAAPWFCLDVVVDGKTHGLASEDEEDCLLWASMLNEQHANLSTSSAVPAAPPAPPQPAAPAAPPDGGVGAATPDLTKFRVMLTARVPLQAVKNKMVLEGLDPDLLDAPEGGTPSAPTPPPPSRPGPPVPSLKTGGGPPPPPPPPTPPSLPFNRIDQDEDEGANALSPPPDAPAQATQAAPTRPLPAEQKRPVSGRLSQNMTGLDRRRASTMAKREDLRTWKDSAAEDFGSRLAFSEAPRGGEDYLFNAFERHRDFGMIKPPGVRYTVAQCYGATNGGKGVHTGSSRLEAAVLRQKRHKDNSTAAEAHVIAAAIGKYPRRTGLSQSALSRSVGRFKHVFGELKVGRDDTWRQSLVADEEDALFKVSHPFPDFKHAEAAEVAGDSEAKGFKALNERERLLYPFRVKGILARRQTVGDESTQAFGQDNQGIPEAVLKQREDTYIDGRCMLDQTMAHLQFEDVWEGLTMGAFSDKDIITTMKLSC